MSVDFLRDQHIFDNYYFCVGNSAVNVIPCSHFNKNKRHKRLHQIVFGQDVPSGTVIDHIDRNFRNNVRSNLRLATLSENAMNARPHWNPNTSGFRGVHPYGDTFIAKANGREVGRHQDPRIAKAYRVEGVRRLEEKQLGQVQSSRRIEVNTEMTCV